MIDKEVADEKVQEGYMRAWLGFNVLGVKQEVAENALDEMIKNLDRDQRVKIYKKDFSEVTKVENPVKGVKEGFSKTVELELISKNFEDLVQIAVEYGPSAIEIMEPKKINLKLGEAQAIINLLSQVMHQFAAAGLGGMVFVRKQDEAKG